MPVYTKTPHDVCAPTDAGGAPRSVDNGDMETLLTEITVAISDLENSTQVPVIARNTWADLAALTGETTGQRAEVLGPDAGTHTDPVVGGAVDNEGVYSWSDSPAGWQWLSDRDTVASIIGGAAVSSQQLRDWTEAESYEPTAITRDADDGHVTSATVKWPDGSAGTYTTTTYNMTYSAIDAYTISHVASGKTVTQAAVTRDATGAVIAKPALTVA